MYNQHGQTLIETLVAAFILVMGITAALGLAIYSLSATNNIKQQTVAIGLAREGLEVVKNIRDTNWLNAALTPDCYDFSTGTDTAYCYQDWLLPAGGDGQDLTVDSGPRTFSLIYDSSLTQPWVLHETDKDFGLNIANFNPSGTFDSVYYIAAPGLGANASNSGFARKITISSDTFPPFDQNTGPRLTVTAQVWWNGKNCPYTTDAPTTSSCMITLKTYLTNWKNF